MISILLCRKIIVYFEKLDVYRIFSIASTVLGVLMFVFSFSDKCFYAYIACMIATGISILTQTSFKYLLVRDLAILDTYYTGYRREGIYQLAIQLPESIIATLCGAFPQLILPLTGWTQNFNAGLDDDTIAMNFSWTTATTWLVRIVSSALIGTSMPLCIHFYLVHDVRLKMYVWLLAVASLASIYSLRRYKLSQSAVELMSKTNKQNEKQGTDQCPRYDTGYMLVMHLTQAEQRAIANISRNTHKEMKTIYSHNSHNWVRLQFSYSLLVPSYRSYYNARSCWRSHSWSPWCSSYFASTHIWG